MLPKLSASEAEEFCKKNADLTAVDILIPDSCGVLRGKRVPISTLNKLYSEGVGFPGSIFAMDVTGETIAATGLVWEDGDPDMVCFPIPGTLQRTTWLKRHAAQVLLHMYGNDGEPFFASPRTVLQKIQKRLRDDGLTPVVAVELEFYLLDSDWGPEDRPRPPLSPNSGLRPHSTQVYGMDELYDFDAVLSEIADACARQGIPADAAVAEYAPGQFEINLHHEDDAVSACDHAILFKRIVRGVAARHKLDATFMAKPYPDFAGSGMHVHMSLLDRDGRNVFESADPFGSPVLRNAVGGLQATMAEGMAIFAPNANSYRRFQVESYAPNAPTWGVNNRTTALRVPSGPPASRRVEHRVAGADANPYLAVAAILAGAHHGIMNGVEPDEPVTGNGYERTAGVLPSTWVQALDAFERSTVLADYLGREFVHVFLEARWAERDKFFAYVTPLEYEWYLRTA